MRTLPARDDLRRIWLYIAQDNLAAADRLIDEIERTLRLLARNPQMGQAVDQYHAGLRQMTVGSYVLFYEPIDGGVRLVRALQGSRNLDDLLN